MIHELNYQAQLKQLIETPELNLILEPVDPATGVLYCIDADGKKDFFPEEFVLVNTRYNMEVPQSLPGSTSSFYAISQQSDYTITIAGKLVATLSSLAKQKIKVHHPRAKRVKSDQ